MKKIIKRIQDDPSYLIYKITRKLKINLRSKVFSNIKEFRSASDNGNYLSTITKVLKNQKSFENFKKFNSYRDILEHVSKEQGEDYLKILESRDDQILDLGLDSVLSSDDLGNPVKFRYSNKKIPLSPTTLRYLKVSSDLNILFGCNLGRVAEIGCGYGGQTLVNDQLLNVTFAKLFDLPIVNKLIDRYLNSFLLKGSFLTTVINKEEPHDYDLVISNYAFSELPKNLQLVYIDKVISKSKCGYLTMNSGLENDGSVGKLDLNELRDLLPKFSLIKEEPLTAEHNYIIVWGHSQQSLEKNFKPFKTN